MRLFIGRVAVTTVLVLASLLAGPAFGEDYSILNPERTGTQLPDPHEDHGFTPKDREPLVLEPVVAEVDGALPAWSLVALPVLGAAAGGIVGLQRRRARA